MRDDTSIGCLLPLAQALITGLLAAVMTGVGAALAGFETGRALLVALLVGAGAAALVWLTALRAWRALAYHLEDFTGQDLTGDGEVGEPAAPMTVRVELLQEGGRNMSFIDLPANPDQLVKLASGLLAGSTLSEAQWTGAAGGFTRAEFAQLRAELLRRGLACWNSPGTPARGAALTPAGRAIMHKFASMAGGNTPHITTDGH